MWLWVQTLLTSMTKAVDCILKFTTQDRHIVLILSSKHYTSVVTLEG